MKTSTVLFTAHAFAAEEIRDLNAYVVVLSEHEDGDGETLEFQRALQHDGEQGAEDVCVVLSAGATHYGGLESWCISGDALELHFAADAARTLGIEPHVSIELRLGEEARGRLDEGLRRVLELPPSSA